MPDEKLSKKYAKIINLKYTGVRNHVPATMEKRAAQFSPFAALEGHMPLMHEQERYVEPKHVLDDDELRILNEKVNILKRCVSELPEIDICYFIPDKTKEGGTYRTDRVKVRFVDTVRGFIRADNDEKYVFERIRCIDGDLYKDIREDIQ